MKKLLFLLSLFLIATPKIFSQDYSKTLQSKTWYVIGDIYEKKTLKLYSDKKQNMDWYGNFLPTNKIIYNGIIKESSIDQDGNELAVGSVIKNDNYTYLIKKDLIKIIFHSNASKNQDEVTIYYYYKITETTDKKGLVFTPISETSFK
jgi:hypothetical protein